MNLTRIDYDVCLTERQFFHSLNDQTSRFEDSRARIEWYRSNMRAKICFAKWHSRIFILWKCFKQSLNVISFLWFLMKFFQMSSTQRIIDDNVHEIFWSSFFKRRNEFPISKKYDLNQIQDESEHKNFFICNCLYRVRCSIIKKHWLIYNHFYKYTHVIFLQWLYFCHWILILSFDKKYLFIELRFSQEACYNQCHEKNWHFITYLLRKLLSAKQNYNVHNKKLLIIITTLENWKMYVKKISKLTIFTNHKNLLHFITIKQLNKRISQMIKTFETIQI